MGKMLSRLLAGTLLVATAASIAADDDRIGPFWSLAQTYYQIQRCIGWSDYEIRIIKNAQLNVHSVPINFGMKSDTLSDCLSSGAEIIATIRPTDSHTVVVYLPPHDNGSTLRGDPVKIPEVLIASDTEVTIIPSSGDHGIEDLLHVSRSIFFVQIGLATHSRIYRVNVSTGETDYVTNGSSMEVEDPIVPTFRVKATKSYFRRGGALWIDTIIDEYGNILEIVMPISELYVECMTVKDLSENSDLDLSRMAEKEVCIRR